MCSQLHLNWQLQQASYYTKPDLALMLSIKKHQNSRSWLSPLVWNHTSGYNQLVYVLCPPPGLAGEEHNSKNKGRSLSTSETLGHVNWLHRSCQIQIQLR